MRLYCNLLFSLFSDCAHSACYSNVSQGQDLPEEGESWNQSPPVIV